MSFRVEDGMSVPRYKEVVPKKEITPKPIVRQNDRADNVRIGENNLYGVLRRNTVQRAAALTLTGEQPATPEKPPTPYEAVQQINRLPVPDSTDQTAVREYNRQRAQIADQAVANGKPPTREDFASLPGRLADYEYQDSLNGYNSRIAELRDISTRATAQPTVLPLDAPLPPYAAVERINQIPVPDPANAAALDQYIQQTQMIAEAALGQAKPPTREDFAGLHGQMRNLEYEDARQAYNQATAALQPYADGISYVRYDATVDYMFGEMKNNLNSEEFKFIKTNLDLIADPPLFSGGNGAPGYLTAALAKFYDQVKTGGPWDHKPILQDRLGLEPGVDLRFPVRGDTEHEVFYDIWSNIHYGYIGTAAGFGEGELQKAADIAEEGTGKNDPADKLTIQIGIDLWNEYGADLTKEQFDYEVRSRLPELIAAQESPEYTSKNPDFQHVTDIYEGNRR